ncbi:hypothetical protein D3C85_1473190 [compost metagenome]
MPTEPQELSSSPGGTPRENSIPGDPQAADGVALRLAPSHRPLKSVRIEEEANVVKIFSLWGKAMDESSALEIQNYNAALLNLHQAEKNR